MLLYKAQFSFQKLLIVLESTSFSALLSIDWLNLQKLVQRLSHQDNSDRSAILVAHNKSFYHMSTLLSRVFLSSL